MVGGDVMAIFGDWNGDGKNNGQDDFIEFMLLSGAMDGQKKSGGGCCLFSFLLILSPFIGAAVLIGSLLV